MFTDGGCEIRPDHGCSFLDPAQHAVRATDEATLLPVEKAPVRRASESRLKKALDSGRFAIIAEVNGADSSSATEFVDSARVVAGVADIVSITDHSGANVHMGNIAATAHLRNAGLDVMRRSGAATAIGLRFKAIFSAWQAWVCATHSSSPVITWRSAILLMHDRFSTSTVPASWPSPTGCGTRACWTTAARWKWHRICSSVRRASVRSAV